MCQRKGWHTWIIVRTSALPGVLLVDDLLPLVGCGKLGHGRDVNLELWWMHYIGYVWVRVGIHLSRHLFALGARLVQRKLRTPNWLDWLEHDVPWYV